MDRRSWVSQVIEERLVGLPGTGSKKSVATSSGCNASRIRARFLRADQAGQGQGRLGVEEADRPDGVVGQAPGLLQPGGQQVRAAVQLQAIDQVDRLQGETADRGQSERLEVAVGGRIHRWGTRLEVAKVTASDIREKAGGRASCGSAPAGRHRPVGGGSDPACLSEGVAISNRREGEAMDGSDDQGRLRIIPIGDRPGRHAGRATSRRREPRPGRLRITAVLGEDRVELVVEHADRPPPDPAG